MQCWRLASLAAVLFLSTSVSAATCNIQLRSGNTFPSAPVSVATPGTTVVPFAAFGSVNWADVDSIRLEFQPG